MNPEEPIDPKELENSKKPSERPERSKMFDSPDPEFYKKDGFREVANEVMFRDARRKSMTILKRFNVRAIHVGPQDVANEAMRRTFEEFPKKIHELEDTASARREYFKNLLSLIASNLTFSLMRTIRSRRETPIEDDLDIPDTAGSQDILQRESDLPTQRLTDKLSKLKEAFAKLSEKDQTILRLRYNEDLSFPEIAKLLGLSVGAVKVREYRARHRLHEWLRDEPDFKHLFQQGGSNA